jgi:hypothetical protein
MPHPATTPTGVPPPARPRAHPLPPLLASPSPRARRQVASLTAELRALAEQRGRSSSGALLEDPAIWASVSEGVARLEAQLSALSAAAAPVLPPAAGADPAHAALQEDLTRKLQRDLLAFAAPPAGAAASSGGSSTGSSGDVATYELYAQRGAGGGVVAPRAGPGAADPTALALAEARLARLEAAVGAVPPGAGAVGGSGSGSGSSPSLLRALHAAESKLALLDPAALDSLGRRMLSLSAEIDALAAAAAASGGSGAASLPPGLALRAASAFDTLERWDAVAVGLPSLVDRLVTLRAAHEQAVGFARRLQQLEASRTAVERALEAGAGTLARLSASVAENGRLMASNAAALDARFAALAARMDALGGSGGKQAV